MIFRTCCAALGWFIWDLFGFPSASASAVWARLSRHARKACCCSSLRYCTRVPLFTRRDLRTVFTHDGAFIISKHWRGPRRYGVKRCKRWPENYINLMMKVTRHALLLPILLLGVFCGTVGAWWGNGHMVVSQAAASQLTPEAAAGVESDLNAYRDMFPARSDVAVRVCNVTFIPNTLFFGLSSSREYVH